MVAITWSMALSLNVDDANSGLARIFHRDAGRWRGDLRGSLRISRQANSSAYWREARAQNDRKSTASARVGRRSKMDRWVMCHRTNIHAPLDQVSGRPGEIFGLGRRCAVTDLPNHFRVGSDCVVIIEKWDSVALPP